MRRYGYNRGFRLDLFDSWLELQTSRCFQMHALTPAARRILERNDYGQQGLNGGSVKAVQVSSPATLDGRDVAGAVLCVSIKVPFTDEMGLPRGLLVHESEEGQAERAQVAGGVQLALFDDGVEPEPVIEPAGLRMTDRNRVMSITPWMLRLMPTGRIVDSYRWGSRDRANPPIPEIPADVLASLAELVLD